MTIVFERLMLPVSLRKRLRHEAGMEPELHLAHLTFDLGLGRQRSDRSRLTTISTAPERTSMSVISSACSPVSGCETSRSLTVDTELFSVRGIERVLGIDEGGGAAQFLHLGDRPAA